ncbi:MAG TPA: hypothetical protein VG405_02600 [Solirubrobacteraceae bacterium]|jgi:hypothetical protein|nr:hypothetical protein [Solirubrobacteraceae bacterium]
MPSIKLPELEPTPAALALGQQLSTAALVGGQLFGRLALGPALREISDKRERGKVLNTSWRRYGTVNSAALATLVGTWIPLRQAELDRRLISRADRSLIAAKDATVGAVALTGLISAAGGVAFAAEEPDGAVPVESGRAPAPETPGRAATLKRLVNATGALNLASELTLVAVNVALHQRQSGRRIRL